MHYGEKIREIREEKNLKLYEVANIIGIEADAYGLYEREYTAIPLKHLITICDYFDVSLDYIFSFTKIKKYFNSNELDLKLSGLRIKEQRKKIGLKQEEFSKILEISRSLLSKYESGKNLINIFSLYILCDKYKISADYLLGKTNEPKYLK